MATREPRGIDWGGVLDHHEPNVRAAEAAGLRGVVHRGDRGDDLRARLAVLGVVTRRS